MEKMSCILVLIVLGLGGACGGEETGSGSAEPEYLFVQSAVSYTLVDGTLTLRGIYPKTVFFSDRPDRIAGMEPTIDFLSEWNEGEDSFGMNPPNADLSVMVGEDHFDAVVVLKKPQLVENDLIYDVEVLEGKLPASGGAASLFIDIIGRPLTPISVAGVARRTTRRTMRRMAFRPHVVVVR